jgi:hypothetical protein
VRWSELAVWDSDECAVNNGGCGDSRLNVCENRCGAPPACHKEVGLYDVVETIVDDTGTRSPEKETGLNLCTASSGCLSLVIQANMSNPEEHCNMDFHNWCIVEGGVVRYLVTLGQKPAVPVKLVVSGEYLQLSPETMFTPEDYNKPHEILLVMVEDLVATGNYWMNLHHTFWINSSYYNSSVIVNANHTSETGWTTRQPALASKTLGWSDLKIVCQDTGYAFPTTIPVLIEDNDLSLVYALRLAVEYASIRDKPLYMYTMTKQIALSLSIDPSRVEVVSVGPSGGERRLQPREATVRRNLREVNYATVTFYFMDAVPGAPTPTQLFKNLTKLLDSGSLAVTIPGALSLESRPNGKFGFRMDTIVGAGRKVARGPFVLDSTFTMRSKSNQSGFFTEDQPDAAFALHGSVYGTYIFRPCIHWPIGMPLDDVYCEKTEAQLCTKDPALGPCTASCMWNEVLRYENNLPTIYVAFDDPCFQDYSTQGQDVTLYAWVASQSPHLAEVSVVMSKGIKWSWKPLNVELQAPTGAWATGFEARPMVHSGSKITSLDVRAFEGLENLPGLRVFNRSLHFADINPPLLYLVPPPPPTPWGAAGHSVTRGQVIDERMYTRKHRASPGPFDSCAVTNASYVLNNASCINRGICSDWPYLDHPFTNHYGCVCPFTHAGSFCEKAVYKEIRPSTPMSVGIHNITLRTAVPHGGSSVRWSEVAVWDTDECLVNNGGCGYPFYDTVTGKAKGFDYLCVNMCGSSALCVDSASGDTLQAASLVNVTRRIATKAPDNATNVTVLDNGVANSAQVLCTAQEPAKLAAEFVVELNMSNPEESCDIAFTPDLCVKEGGVLRYSIKLAQKPAADIYMLIHGGSLQTNKTTTFTSANWASPQVLTLYFREDILIYGNHWMYLHHEIRTVNPKAPQNSWTHARIPFSSNARDRTAPNSVRTATTAWRGARMYNVRAATRGYRPLTVPILIRENDKVAVDPLIGEYGRKFRLRSYVRPNKPAWRGPFTLDYSFFDDTAEDFWTHDVSKGLPDVAFRLSGLVEGLILDNTQSTMYIFRPCFVEPPGLPTDFYSINGITCDPERDIPKWPGSAGDDEDEDDPLCLWSKANAFETNPPTIYVGYDDPCFRAADPDALIYEDPDWYGAPPGKDAEGKPSMDLYAHVAFKLKVAETTGGVEALDSMAAGAVSSAEATPTEGYVQIAMEKGKRLSAALQPRNVESNANKMTATVGACGTIGGMLGGDPILMLENVQNMVGTGQVGVPVNPGMRDFMSKFSWANFAWFSPPPKFLMAIMVPGGSPTPSPQTRRRLADAAVAAGVEEEEDEKPTSDLPDPNETGNAAFLRKAGANADEYFIAIVMAAVAAPLAAVAVYRPLTTAAETKKNALRNNIIGTQQQCKKHKNFERFVPQFDPLLDANPKWGVPPKYSLKTIIINLITVSNMGLMQCSLLGMFEDTAITTKILALATFILFPCGYIVYVYITLRGAMRPTEKDEHLRFLPDALLAKLLKGEPVPQGESKYRAIGQHVLGSIPFNMKSGDLIFKASIPPALSEPIRLDPPEIPEDADVEEKKNILKNHAAIAKEMTKQRASAIRALGPDAINLTGKWITKSKAAEGWLSQYGDLIAPYGPNGYNTVTFKKAKRLVTVMLLCILSTATWMSGIQAKCLMLLAMIEMGITMRLQPYRNRFKNLEVIIAMSLVALMTICPILLEYHLRNIIIRTGILN